MLQYSLKSDKNMAPCAGRQTLLYTCPHCHTLVAASRAPCHAQFREITQSRSCDAFFTGAVEWHLLPAVVWDCSCVGLTRDLPLFCVSNRVYIVLQRCAGAQCRHGQYVPPGLVLKIPRSVPNAPNTRAASSGNPQYTQLVEQTVSSNDLHLLEERALWSASQFEEVPCRNGQ